MRVVQPAEAKGSLKWIRAAVATPHSVLNGKILDRIATASSISWLSPLRNDDYAEYRDGAFLDRVGGDGLKDALGSFWPDRGPQWDALGRTDDGQLLLVEAKAHIGEFCSPPSKASNASLQKIKASLAECASRLGVGESHSSRWHQEFYQYTNRLAHLWWLRERGCKAWTIFVGFCGDADMPGDTTPAAWEAAFKVADFALGIPARHALSKYIIHAHVQVDDIRAGAGSLE